MTDRTATAADDTELRINDILEDLAWLAQMAEENGDSDIVTHIQAIEDYLNESDSGDEETDMGDDDDDTSAHAYASELVHLSRKAGANVQDAKKSRQTDALEKKRLVKLMQQMEMLAKRIETLEAMPLPAKGALRIVQKSDDRVSVEASLAKLAPAERARELMKIALSNPMEM